MKDCIVLSCKTYCNNLFYSPNLEKKKKLCKNVHHYVLTSKPTYHVFISNTLQSVAFGCFTSRLGQQIEVSKLKLCLIEQEREVVIYPRVLVNRQYSILRNIVSAKSTSLSNQFKAVRLVTNHLITSFQLITSLNQLETNYYVPKAATSLYWQQT